MQCKQLIDDIVINFLYFGNFASIKDIRRKCNFFYFFIYLFFEDEKKI